MRHLQVAAFGVPPFDQLGDVVSTDVGYAGGSMVNPTYQQVYAG